MTGLGQGRSQLSMFENISDSAEFEDIPWPVFDSLPLSMGYGHKQHSFVSIAQLRMEKGY